MTEPDDPGPSRGPDATPSPTFEVLVTDEQSVRIDPRALAAALRRGMTSLGVPSGTTLSVTLAEPDAIAEIKNDAFGEHRTTDILAFPMDSIDEVVAGQHVLGDLVLCPIVALEQARALGVPGEEEIVTLLAHGLLHLIGADHDSPGAEIDMADRQRSLVRSMRGAA
ncbi:MAG: rRNA maturation RNase YbeY [Actinomycetota bacterium]